MKSTLPEPQFFKALKAESEAKGKNESKLETARKLQEHGIPWEVITSSTGVKPADLKTSAKAASARKAAKK